MFCASSSSSVQPPPFSGAALGSHAGALEGRTFRPSEVPPRLSSYQPAPNPRPDGTLTCFLSDQTSASGRQFTQFTHTRSPRAAPSALASLSQRADPSLCEQAEDPHVLTAGSLSPPSWLPTGQATDLAHFSGRSVTCSWSGTAVGGAPVFSGGGGRRAEPGACTSVR